MTREQAINRVTTAFNEQGAERFEGPTALVDSLITLGLLQIDAEIQSMSPAARALVCDLGYSASQAQRLITTLEAAGFTLIKPAFVPKDLP